MKVKFGISTNKVGSKCEEIVDFKQHLSDLDGSDLEQYLDDYLAEWKNSYSDVWWHIEEED